MIDGGTTLLAILADPVRQARTVRGMPTADPTGCHLVVNGTSLGMRADDLLPVDVAMLAPDAIAAEAGLAPDETRFLATAAARGLRTHRGRHMLEAQIEPMLDFMVN